MRATVVKVSRPPKMPRELPAFLVLTARLKSRRKSSSCEVIAVSVRKLSSMIGDSNNVSGCGSSLTFITDAAAAFGHTKTKTPIKIRPDKDTQNTVD